MAWRAVTTAGGWWGRQAAAAAAPPVAVLRAPITRPVAAAAAQSCRCAAVRSRWAGSSGSGARRWLWADTAPLKRPPPPPLPPGAPTPWLYGLERAVVEGRPWLAPRLRRWALAGAFGGVAVASVAAYLYQTVGDGATEREVRELARDHAWRAKPLLEALHDVDVPALMESPEFNTNNLGKMALPTWWVYAESMLSTQLNGLAGLTSYLLHASPLHLAGDLLLLADAFLLFRAIATPWTPVYLLALNLGEAASAAPTFNAPPLLTADPQVAEFGSRLVQGRDWAWLRLHDDVYGTHLSEHFDTMPTGEQLDDLPLEDMMEATGMLHPMESLPMQMVEWAALVNSTQVARAASAQVFWVMTLLTSYLSPADLNAAVRPVVGLLPMLSAAYTTAALEATFVARVAASRYWLRVLGLTLLSAATSADPTVGMASQPMYMVEPPWKAWHGGEEAGGMPSPMETMEQEVPVVFADPMRIAAFIYGGVVTWLMTGGPVRALLYASLRRRAALRVPPMPPAPLPHGVGPSPTSHRLF